MIVFLSILTEKSGLGNYIRTNEIYKKVSLECDCVFYIYTEKSFLYYLEPSVIPIFDENQTLNPPFDLEQIILFCDLPYMTYGIEKFVEKKFKKIIAFNDATVLDINPDYYFNTDSLKKLPLHIQSFTGLEYQIIRKDLITKNQKLDLSIKKIGIMFGGSDPGNLTDQFLKQIINDNKMLSYQFSIVVREEKLIYFENKYPPTIYNFNFYVAPNICEFYLNIDCLINMGGMSTYEAMYVGIPVFSVEWSYMGKYVRSLAELDYITNIGQIDKSIRGIDKAFADKNALERKINNGRKMIDGKATERITKKIIEIYGE